jgi:hypothetical protein
MGEERYVIIDVDFASLLEEAMRLDREEEDEEEEEEEDSDGSEEEECALGNGEVAHPGKKSRIFYDFTKQTKPLNRSHRNRKKKRDAAQEQGHPRRMDTVVDLINKSDLVHLQKDASEVLCASSCGYGGKRDGGKKKEEKVGVENLVYHSAGC